MRINIFRDKNYLDELLREDLKLTKNYAWKISKAREDMYKLNEDFINSYFTKILYRPFDIRWIF